MGGDRPDEALLAALKSSGPDQRRGIADELFGRYYVRVARWCYRLTGTQEEAADLAQEVFIKAYRNLHSFRGDAQFSTWLYAIVRNEAASRYRRSSAHPIGEGEEVLESVPATSPPPDAGVDDESRRAQITRFLADTLDDDERTVFVLHHGNDMTLDQITRLLGLTNPSGAKAYLVSARRKLTRAVQRLRAKGDAL